MCTLFVKSVKPWLRFLKLLNYTLVRAWSITYDPSKIQLTFGSGRTSSPSKVAIYCSFHIKSQKSSAPCWLVRTLNER